MQTEAVSLNALSFALAPATPSITLRCLSFLRCLKLESFNLADNNATGGKKATPTKNAHHCTSIVRQHARLTLGCSRTRSAAAAPAFHPRAHTPTLPIFPSLAPNPTLYTGPWRPYVSSCSKNRNRHRNRKKGGNRGDAFHIFLSPESMLRQCFSNG